MTPAARSRITIRTLELYEDKLGEWGYLNGRPVVVDYAMRVHMTPDDLELIDPRVRTISDVMRE